ncbi:UTP--glucose-1-phosphate uridylyltransferase AglF [Candidatus Tiddalikarchaeum anstoanum]|nr:UTP--glucose-1-phosphate uridylyltransferase AglF [Candidatus Tiddalikarchaeum anstoanum]
MIGLIPAAGSGTRMYPFTKANPKELFPVQRKAVIDHVVETLHNYAGVDKIFVIVGSHKGAIIDHLGDGTMFNSGKLKIGYLFQEERKGLAHAILQGKGWIDEDFIVHVGDAFINPEDEMKKAVLVHKKEKPFATILAREVDNPTLYGILRVNDKGELVDTIEKPTLEQAKPFKVNGKYLVNLGIYIFNKKVFDYIEKTPPGLKGEYQVPDVFKTALKNGEKIKVVSTNAMYLDMGNWDSVEEAWDYFKKK